jgi:FMN phosphatase YigB (HAD superfamily)
MNTIIFDFNRTLYNPDQGMLIPGAELVLQELTRRKFKLCLISYGTKEKRKLIHNLGIEKYFDRIIVTPKKSIEDFKQCFGKEAGIVVGDRVKEEICIGNMLGAKTIWVQSGKYGVEVPEIKEEQPTHTVQDIQEVLTLV